MELSPENTERLKRVALIGAGLAVASIAWKHNKVIGDRVRHASVWEASQSVLIDLIDGAKRLRLSGTLIRNSSDEIVDIDNLNLISGDNSTNGDEAVEALEEAFSPEEAEPDT